MRQYSDAELMRFFTRAYIRLGSRLVQHGASRNEVATIMTGAILEVVPEDAELIDRMGDIMVEETLAMKAEASGEAVRLPPNPDEKTSTARHENYD